MAYHWRRIDREEAVWPIHVDHRLSEAEREALPRRTLREYWYVSDEFGDDFWKSDALAKVSEALDGTYFSTIIRGDQEEGIEVGKPSFEEARLYVESLLGLDGRLMEVIL
jgi:hypothetical protein